MVMENIGNILSGNYQIAVIHGKVHQRKEQLLY